mgnify:CR=1 FL=1
MLGRLRIQVLSPTLIRLEEAGPAGFEDRATFTVVERNWPGATFTAGEEADLVEHPFGILAQPGPGARTATTLPPRLPSRMVGCADQSLADRSVSIPANPP